MRPSVDVPYVSSVYTEGSLLATGAICVFRSTGIAIAEVTEDIHRNAMSIMLFTFAIECRCQIYENPILRLHRADC